MANLKAKLNKVLEQAAIFMRVLFLAVQYDTEGLTSEERGKRSLEIS